jgi:hypothetical protein
MISALSEWRLDRSAEPFEIQSYAIIASPTSRRLPIHIFVGLPFAANFHLACKFWQQLHAHIKFLSRIEISTFRKLEPHRSNGANEQWSKKSLGNFIRVLSRARVCSGI